MSKTENLVQTQATPASVPLAPPRSRTPSQIVGLSEIVKTIKDVSEVADKRASTFLLSVGTVLISLALIFKVKLFGLTVGDISKIEFVALLVACLGCLFCGAYVRMLQERLTNEHELRLLETTLRYSLKSQAMTDEIALAAQDLSQRPTKTILKDPKDKPSGG